MSTIESLKIEEKNANYFENPIHRKYLDTQTKKTWRQKKENSHYHLYSSYGNIPHACSSHNKRHGRLLISPPMYLVVRLNVKTSCKRKVSKQCNKMLLMLEEVLQTLWIFFSRPSRTFSLKISNFVYTTTVSILAVIISWHFILNWLK